MNSHRILWSSVLGLFIVLILTFTVFAVESTSTDIPQNTLPTTSEVYIPSETMNQPQTFSQEPIAYSLSLSEDISELQQALIDAELIKEEAKKSKSYFYWESSEKVCQYYSERIESILKAEEEKRWERKASEYPTATMIWNYLKDLNYNDYVCAGIIGNMMAETGGQTLDIQADLYSASGGFYGICQWNEGYEIHGANLTEQLDFLADTIKYEIDTFGYAYQSNFDLNTFLSLENEQDAAVAFAKTYERCAPESYGTRASNATDAYNYFVNS